MLVLLDFKIGIYCLTKKNLNSNLLPPTKCYVNESKFIFFKHYFGKKLTLSEHMPPTKKDRIR